MNKNLIINNTFCSPPPSPTGRITISEGKDITLASLTLYLVANIKMAFPRGGGGAPRVPLAEIDPLRQGQIFG